VKTSRLICVYNINLNWSMRIISADKSFYTRRLSSTASRSATIFACPSHLPCCIGITPSLLGSSNCLLQSTTSSQHNLLAYLV
jgi:hypothetical protein